MDIALVRGRQQAGSRSDPGGLGPLSAGSCIVVVDDQVASDFFRETVIRMAVPSEVRVVISGVAEFAETYSFTQGYGKKTIVLFSTVTAALTVHRLGFRFAKLNIGNIYNENCLICCTPSVLLSDKDISDITHLHDEGVQIEVRRVPQGKTGRFLRYRPVKVLTDGSTVKANTMILKIIIVSVVGGILCLDRVVLQAMISRPIVAAPVIGLILGDPYTGLIVGAFIELFWIDRFPIGAYFLPTIPSRRSWITVLDRKRSLSRQSFARVDCPGRSPFSSAGSSREANGIMALSGKRKTGRCGACRCGPGVTFGRLPAGISPLY